MGNIYVIYDVLIYASILLAAQELYRSKLQAAGQVGARWHLHSTRSQIPIPLSTFLADCTLQLPLWPTMAEQDFNLALVNDQGPSTPAPQDQQTSAPSVGVTGPNRPPQSPQTGRGSGRGQKTPRGRANAQRTPPPGRDSRRSSAGSEGRSQALLKPGRRAGLIVNLKESFGFVR